MRSAQLLALFAILSFQTIGVAVLTGFWVYEFFTEGSDDLVSAVSLLLVMVAAIGWLAAITTGIFQKKRWAFSSSIVAEILTVILGLCNHSRKCSAGVVVAWPCICLR
jgi:hypothetical protein